MPRLINALKFAGLGWYIAICVITGTVSGVAADRMLGLAPLFTIIGVLTGSVVAFWGLYRMVKQIVNKKMET